MFCIAPLPHQPRGELDNLVLALMSKLVVGWVQPQAAELWWESLFCQQRWKLPWLFLPKLICRSLNLLFQIPAPLPSPPCSWPRERRQNWSPCRVGAAPACGNPFPRDSPAEELQVVSSPWSVASLGAWRHMMPLLPAPSPRPVPFALGSNTTWEPICQFYTDTTLCLLHF